MGFWGLKGSKKPKKKREQPKKAPESSSMPKPEEPQKAKEPPAPEPKPEEPKKAKASSSDVTSPPARSHSRPSRVVGGGGEEEGRWQEWADMAIRPGIRNFEMTYAKTLRWRFDDDIDYYDHHEYYYPPPPRPPPPPFMPHGRGRYLEVPPPRPRRQQMAPIRMPLPSPPAYYHAGPLVPAGYQYPFRGSGYGDPYEREFW